ncbi:hypothetical protein DOTSEDRAFT_69939 [Dothistroma septosporum NZE10]|uniref:Uncharacterized protein n=1 Tax=Dothistroma septosporum (strain NZE10 / CBS 128990) TaxID=675120 RepID=N1PXM2_DOTSN|nr:hypothetical protein DOTSEDRAFT_69939 [Dothistroma septosporum NZE10]
MLPTIAFSKWPDPRVQLCHRRRDFATMEGGAASLDSTILSSTTQVLLLISSRALQPTSLISFAHRIQSCFQRCKTIVDLPLTPRDSAVLQEGDYNRFQYVQPFKTLTAVSGLRSLDDFAGIRYTEQSYT